MYNDPRTNVTVDGDVRRNRADPGKVAVRCECDDAAQHSQAAPHHTPTYRRTGTSIGEYGEGRFVTHGLPAKRREPLS